MIWKIKGGNKGKPLPADCVLSGSALSLRFAFSKHSGFLQAHSIYSGCLEKHLCSSALQSPCCAADMGSLWAEADFSGPMCQELPPPEHVQVFSRGNFPSPHLGSHTVLSATCTAQVLQERQWEAVGKPNAVRYHCLCYYLSLSFALTVPKHHV